MPVAPEDFVRVCVVAYLLNRCDYNGLFPYLIFNVPVLPCA